MRWRTTTVRSCLTVLPVLLFQGEPVALAQSAPTGPLPVIVPSRPGKVNYTALQTSSGDIRLGLGGESFEVQSQFSTPARKWEKGPNRYFTFERHLEQRDEAILVRDTFTNLTDDNLPVMQRHRVPMTRLQKVWLGGSPSASLKGVLSEPANPTTFGVTEKTGIGLMPLNDVFQVHVTNSCDGETIELADNQLVIKPRASYTAEWAIVLPATPEYYPFLNAARRLLQVNFLVDGPATFLRADPRNVGRWSDAEVEAFLRHRSAKYLITSISHPLYQGLVPHGTVFQQLDLREWRREGQRRRRLRPDVKQLGYFHCFLEVLEDAAEKYPEARMLNIAGEQVTYGNPSERLFLPTASGRFGRDIARNVDMIVQDLRFEGVYWDEMEFSRYRYHYGTPWDGVSADINPATMKITHLKSSVTLVTQPWRLALAQRILKSGTLIANGAPHTRTMAGLHFPRFVETGAISHCTRAHLFTPIALGDHLTEHTEGDAYRHMLRALDHGCVYYWYSDLPLGVLSHRHLTEFMFPITPVELHAGYILGQERILTRRSGLYGWDDASTHEVHVFDDRGREATDFKAPAVRRDGKTLTELRLPENWSAAVVRGKR